MYINFWYVADLSENVKEEPVHVRMLTQDFVLFRDSSGKAHCLSNVCVHRGGSLAHGKRKGDCVECPYHGWQFNGAGECTRIPSMGPDAKIPSRAKVDSYPVEERYGLIFAFLGDMPEEERPPIMEVPEYGQEGWRPIVQTRDSNIDYKRAIENALDPAHNEFVHPTHGFSGGDDQRYRVPELDMREDEWGVGFMTTYVAPPLTDRKMQAASKRTETAVVEAGSGTHGPAHLWTHIHPTKDVSMHQYGFGTPIDETHRRGFGFTFRNFLLEPENDERFLTRNKYVGEQDRVVLERMQPKITPATNTTETFVPADKLIARYREKLKEWEDHGWRIDTEEIERNKDKVAYAIPSPARRHSKGWALDPIPLLPAAKKYRAAAE